MKASISPVSLQANAGKTHANIREYNALRFTVQNGRNAGLADRNMFSFEPLQAKCRQFESVKLHQGKIRARRKK
jgi:hypothetical protein